MTPAEESLMPAKPLLGEASVSRAHDQQLRAIVDAHFDFIWRLLRRRGLSRQDADDAAQQVFMTATEKIELIAPGSERTYLYGVALRVTANWRRKSHRRSEDQLGLPAETPDDAALPDEAAELGKARALLDELLGRLPDELRRVLVLVEIEQLEVAQVAAVEGIPIGTAASRLRRARQLFREALERAPQRNPFRQDEP
jgi:RNA polymerase sigma-70 factor (ECF subfamily)